MTTTIKTSFTKSLIGIFCFASMAANAGQNEIDQVEAAASHLNTEQLVILIDEMSGYDKALAQYRLAVSANLTEQSELANNAIDAAIGTLEALDQTQPENVEVKALLAQVYGYKIALSPIKGVYYGPKSQAMLTEAEQLAPNNPRVQLVKGIGALNTPALFGGSRERALESFDKAIKAYDNDHYSDYYWGHAESYTWKGLMLYREGMHSEAKALWNQALEVDADYGWAKSLLAKVQ